MELNSERWEDTYPYTKMDRDHYEYILTADDLPLLNYEDQFEEIREEK